MPKKNPCPDTLATVLGRLDHAEHLTAAKKREIASAIRTLCKVRSAEPHQLVASAAALQAAFRDALPAAHGISGARWRNIKSLVRQGYALIDAHALPARSRSVLLPAWTQLIQAPETAPHRRGIARFSKWCSAHNIGPDAVRQDVFDRFGTDLAEHCILRSAIETQQTAAKAWNAARKAVPGWPGLELQTVSRRRNPSLPWNALPESFRADVEAYLQERNADEIRFDIATVQFRPATVRHKRAQIRQLATCLVESGVPSTTITDLGCLVNVENARSALGVFIKRAGAKTTPRIYGLSYFLVALAKHWVKADSETISELKTFCRQLNPNRSGMTEKNSKRLRQFDDPYVRTRFLGLPANLMEAAGCVSHTTKAEARLAQLAVALEILTYIPLRISNLASLEFGRTVLIDGKTGYIRIPAAEVKNSVDLDIPLSPQVIDMLKLYQRRYHKLLAPPGCRLVFPSADGSHKRSVTLGTQIKRCLRTRIGVEFNVHLARHLAAKLFLEHHPGEYGIVQRLLGHKSIETTISAYCGTEIDAAFRRFSHLVETRRLSEMRSTT